MKLVTNALIVIIFLSLAFNIDLQDEGFGTDLVPALKYFTVVISLGLILFQTAVILSNKLSFKFSKDFNFIFAFFFISLAGSLYTLIGNGFDIENSFTGRALSVIPFFIAYLLFKHIEFDILVKFISVITWVHIAIAFVMSTLIYYSFFTGQIYSAFTSKVIYHEEISLSLSTIILISDKIKIKPFKYLLLFIIVSSGIMIWKNTSLILLFITLFISFSIKFEKILRSRILKIFAFSLLALIVGQILYLVLTGSSDILPSGSTEVRLATYYKRFQEFLGSPIYGSLFSGTPLVEVGWLVIPSHSDLLDVLAFGGIIGIFLFLKPIISPLINYTKNYKHLPSEITNYYLFSINMVACILFTLCFNPILGQPRLIIFLWFALGFVLAINERIYHPEEDVMENAEIEGNS